MRQPILEAASLLVESVHSKVEEAEKILDGDRKTALAIQRIDPYDDHRFTPTIARWLKSGQIKSIDEHLEDIRLFKDLKAKLKKTDKIRMGSEIKKKIFPILKFKGEDAKSPADIQDWNRRVSEALDPVKNMDDKGLPVEMKYGDFIVYKINKKEHCHVPIVRNSMANRWCVTGSSYGSYGGPPYYPVVRISTREPVAMLIPKYVGKDPKQAIRNASNNGWVGPEVAREIMPIIRKIMPKGYVKWVDSDFDESNLDFNSSVLEFTKQLEDWNMSLSQLLEKHPEMKSKIEEHYLQDPESALEILKVFGKDKRWPDAEKVVMQSPSVAVGYALHIGEPWPEAEDIIAQDLESSLKYAINVLEDRFEKAEPMIIREAEAQDLVRYAQRSVKGRFEEGEDAIIERDESSNLYQISHYVAFLVKKGIEVPQKMHDAFFSRVNNISARIDYFRLFMSKNKRAPKAVEKEIAKNAYASFTYARDSLGKRFEEGEPAIMQDAQTASMYATIFFKDGGWKEAEEMIFTDVEATKEYIADVIKRPYPPAEDTLKKDGDAASWYATNILKGPFKEGEQEIAKDGWNSLRYARSALKKQRFPEGEGAIARKAEVAYEYAAHVLGERFKRGEERIARSKYAFEYWDKVMNKEKWDKAEKAFAKNPMHAYHYALATKERIKSAEKTMVEKNRDEYTSLYFHLFPEELKDEHIVWARLYWDEVKHRKEWDGAIEAFKNDPSYAFYYAKAINGRVPELEDTIAKSYALPYLKLFPDTPKTSPVYRKVYRWDRKRFEEETGRKMEPPE